ncbi:MAG TPA: NAD(P)H-binding protein [Usitatibacter sp.]|jgi:uncharacterized protein YbjT (DUF2867 family)|nr:NAD(P)H-binding protein [Usitatibacter sp.]
MRILLLGANGFIGRELGAALQARGHAVVPGVRRASQAPAFSTQAPMEIDLARDCDAETWLPRLEGIDAVVNCAGILQARRGDRAEAIHVRAPAALYAACLRSNARRVVLVSAISATPSAGTAYARTKLAGEDALRSTALEWVVLRPSLVHARGAYGGTALLRGLAALPGFIPVPGEGAQAFQPIGMDDLAQVVVKAVESDALVRRTLEPVGPDVVTLRAIVVDYRRWLGLGPAIVVPIPGAFARVAARIGDLAGGTLNSTAWAQLEHGNTGDAAAYARQSGLSPLGWRAALARHPAHAQDRWHARLYFVRPLLRIALALLWIASGLVGAAAVATWSGPVAQALGVSGGSGAALLGFSCLLDIVLGTLVLARWKPAVLAALQAAVVIGYTAVAGIVQPALWLDPFGPLLKNLPVLAAIAALAAIEEDR